MIKFLFIFVSAFLLAGCNFETGGAYQSQVLVVPDPVGKDAELISRSPLIFLSGGTFTCRPKPISETAIRNNLVNWKVSNDLLKSAFGIDPIDENADTTTTTTTTNPKSEDPVQVPVGDNWLKLGFNIFNNSSYFLVIDSIVFSGTARHKRQSFSYTSNISSGYCGAAALYVVPAATRVEYRPYSNSPLQNLTIYLDGFTIIDRLNETSNSTVGTADAGTNFGQDNQSAFGGSLVKDLFSNFGGSTDGSININNEESVIIPNYAMKATLRGYFITPKGSRLATFSRTVTFSTQSSLLSF